MSREHEDEHVFASLAGYVRISDASERGGCNKANGRSRIVDLQENAGYAAPKCHENSEHVNPSLEVRFYPHFVFIVFYPEEIVQHESRIVVHHREAQLKQEALHCTRYVISSRKPSFVFHDTFAMHGNRNRTHETPKRSTDIKNRHSQNQTVEYQRQFSFAI